MSIRQRGIRLLPVSMQMRRSLLTNQNNDLHETAEDGFINSVAPLVIAVTAMMLEHKSGDIRNRLNICSSFVGSRENLAERQGSRGGVTCDSPHIQTSRPELRFDLTSSAISQAVARACSVLIGRRIVYEANGNLGTGRAEIAQILV